MFAKMNRRFVPALAAGLAVIFGLGMPSNLKAQTGGYRLKLINKTDYTIYRLYVSSVRDPDWGNDLLGENGTITPGSAFTVVNIQPGKYDVKIVDQLGDACEVRSHEMQANDSWNLVNSWFLRCQGYYGPRTTSRPPTAQRWSNGLHRGGAEKRF